MVIVRIMYKRSTTVPGFSQVLINGSDNDDDYNDDDDDSGGDEDDGDGGGDEDEDDDNDITMILSSFIEFMCQVLF